MEAVVHGPGEGERHAVGPSELVLKATGEETAGSFFLSESTVAPGFPGPPLHVHDRLHDMFYVLDGTLTLRVRDETHSLDPGSFGCIPPGVAHTFANTSDAPVRFLNFNTPAGWEHYMRELAEAARSAPLTPELIGPIAARHDFRVAE